MMKKTLLLATALLMVTSAGAQLKRPMAIQKPKALMQEMKMGTPVTPILQSNRDTQGKPYYIRPAGAFAGTFAIDPVNESSMGLFYSFLLHFKPFVDYTFKAVGDGVSNNAVYAWQNFDDAISHNVNGHDLTIRYGVQNSGDIYEVPKLSVTDAGTNYQFQIGSTYSQTFYPAQILSDLNLLSYSEDTEILVSSKTFCFGGRWGDERYIYTYYSGCDPYGNNESGWWFGKNGGFHGKPINGIAQAFEKPTAPYILKKVFVDYAVLEVSGPVQMTCRVYKLNGIPPYQEQDSVILDDRIGELIATGIATINANDLSDDYIIPFTLYDPSGMSIITPVIEEAILITLEDYNNAWMGNLTDFSACISEDMEADEGYGELAYLKTGIMDDNGNFTGAYHWIGLNNFFINSDGSHFTMKTGLSIFMNIDQPYIGFYNSLNPGEYTFPAEGGLMQQQYSDGTPLEKSIRFTSSSPYSADVWSVASVDGGSVPNWLHMMIQNNVDFVNVRINADVLPAGTTYREATVRFSIPGAYIDYTFKQGEKSTLRGDVNGDGYVTIDDVTKLINYLLTDNADGVYLENANANLDGAINIDDVTTLISYLLTDSWPNSIFNVNGVTFSMVPVAGGTFTMGATPEQGASTSDYDYPPHQVTLSSFFIGQTEVTQELWQAVMGTNPSHFPNNPQLPVEYVSWDDCQTFITQLNLLTGKNFRLPTEAEWEFAARGGNKSLGYKFAGSNTATEVGWIYNNSNSSTHVVASKTPNELGLYDMCGNVLEWAQDWYAAYTDEAQVNPVGPETGQYRILRGGSWYHSMGYGRNGYRGKNLSNARLYTAGLRLAM